MYLPRIAACITVLALPAIAPAQTTTIDPGTALLATSSANSAPRPAPVDARTLSCRALKDDIRQKGTLQLLDGPRGRWADTFYGPAVPNCEFWLRPQFTYVRAQDGLCGVGYICAQQYDP